MSLCARVPDVQGGARGRGDAKAARLSHCPFISGCFVKATWGQESSAGPALLPRPEEQRLTTALPGLTQKSKQASHQGCLFSINHNLGTKRSECRCSWETHTQGLGGLLFGSGPTSDTSRVQSGRREYAFFVQTGARSIDMARRNHVLSLGYVVLCFSCPLCVHNISPLFRSSFFIPCRCGEGEKRYE